MPLLRDDRDFDVAIQETAHQLGDLDPTFVEKTYWVTQVLRSLNRHFAGGFLFKAAPVSLKCYGIIEDVDILRGSEIAVDLGRPRLGGGGDGRTCHTGRRWVR